MHDMSNIKVAIYCPPLLLLNLIPNSIFFAQRQTNHNGYIRRFFVVPNSKE